MVIAKMTFFAIWHVGLTLYSFASKRGRGDDSSSDKIVQFGMISFLLGSFALSTALVVLIAQA